MNIQEKVEKALEVTAQILTSHWVDVEPEADFNAWEDNEVYLENVSSIFDSLIYEHGVVPMGYKLHYTMTDSDTSYEDMLSRVVVFNGLKVVHSMYFEDLLEINGNEYGLLSKEGFRDLLTAVFNHEEQVNAVVNVKEEKTFYEAEAYGNKAKIYIQDVFVPGVDSLYYTNYRGIEIASVIDEQNDVAIYLETQGEVRVSNEEKDEYFRNELPDELLEIILKGESLEEHGYYLGNNNWYELSVFKKQKGEDTFEYFTSLGIVDSMPSSKEELIKLMQDAYDTYQTMVLYNEATPVI